MLSMPSEFVPGVMSEKFFRDVPRRPGVPAMLAVPAGRDYRRPSYQHQSTALSRARSLEHLREWRAAFEADRRARGVPPSGVRGPLVKARG